MRRFRRLPRITFRGGVRGLSANAFPYCRQAPPRFGIDPFAGQSAEIRADSLFPSHCTASAIGRR
jgi:hypothetical protein